MSKFIKIPAKDCLGCYFYDTCFLDGVGTEIEGQCEKGYIWKFKK